MFLAREMTLQRLADHEQTNCIFEKTKYQPQNNRERAKWEMPIQTMSTCYSHPPSLEQSWRNREEARAEAFALVVKAFRGKGSIQIISYKDFHSLISVSLECLFKNKLTLVSYTGIAVWPCLLPDHISEMKKNIMWPTLKYILKSKEYNMNINFWDSMRLFHISLILVKSPTGNSFTHHFPTPA